MHASDAVGRPSEHPTRDRDAAVRVTEAVATDREASKDLEILGLLFGELLEQRKCLRGRADFEEERGQIEHLLEGFLVPESIRGFIQLHAGELRLAAPEEGLREPSASQGHLGIEATGDFEFHPGFVESVKGQRRKTEFPVCRKIGGFDLEHATESIDRFRLAVHRDEESSTREERLDRRGMLPKFGEVELQGPFRTTRRGEDRGDPGAKLGHARGLPHRLSIAPARLIVRLGLRLQIAHRDETAGHLLESLLRFVVRDFGIFVSFEPVEGRDQNRVDPLFSVRGLDRTACVLGGIRGSVQPERELGAGSGGAIILGQEQRRLPHGGEGLLEPAHRIEHHRQGRVPFTADRVDFDRSPNLLLRFRAATVRQQSFGSLGVIFRLVPVAHLMIPRRKESRRRRGAVRAAEIEYVEQHPRTSVGQRSLPDNPEGREMHDSRGIPLGIEWSTESMSATHANPMRSRVATRPRRIVMVRRSIGGGVMLAGAFAINCSAVSTPSAPKDGVVVSSGERFGAPRATVTNRFIDEDVVYLASVFANPAVPRELRVGAAERMARLGSPEAASAIGTGLDSDSTETREIVVEGVRKNGRASDAIVDRIANAAIAGRIGSEDASFIIGRSGSTAIERLMLVVAEASDPAARARGFELLGGINDPAAARTLVEAMQQASPGGDDAVAIDAALRRWSDTSSTRDAAAWRAWWTKMNIDGSASQALGQLVDRIERANRRAARAEARADALASRLAELHARLLATLPESDRDQRILELLEDEELPLRAAAIAQVERMLRNGRILPEVLRAGLLSTLDDPDPTIRITAGRLLETVGGEDFAAKMVASLEDEADPAVLSAGLELLGNRARPAVVRLAIRHLDGDDPEVVRQSARALATVAAAGVLEPERMAEIRAAIPAADRVRDSEIARLAVLVAVDPGDPSLVRLLGHEDRRVRRGAAEGFLGRGQREALRRNSETPEVRRIAWQAWSGDAVDPEGLAVLLELRPPEDAEEADQVNWGLAIARVLERLPAEQVLAADDVLGDEPARFEDRRAALVRAAMSESQPKPDRDAAARRLARRLIEAGRPIEAANELRLLGADADSTLGLDLFEALVLAEAWEEAGGVRSDPPAWVAFLEASAIPEPRLARVLLQEIDRRFGDSLDEPQRVAVEAVRVLLVDASDAVGSEPVADGI